MVTASCEHFLMVQDLGKGTRDPSREPKKSLWGNFCFVFCDARGRTEHSVRFSLKRRILMREGEMLFPYYFSVDIDILQRATIFL